MNILIVSALFFTGSAVGQYLIKHISVNFENNRIFALSNLIAAASLILILAVTQGCYMLALKKHNINVAYPLVVGSSFLGVTTMSFLVLQEQLKSHVVIGSALVVAGLIIVKK